jgi:chromosome segregation ATPase
MLFATSGHMNCKRIFNLSVALLFSTAAWGQSASGNGTPANLQDTAQVTGVESSAQSGTPVSYASVSKLNGILSQVETASKDTQADLQRLRIDHWKTDKTTKEQVLTNVDSIQRNLEAALPDIIAQLRSAPENLSDTFKLYRNLDALYDVLGNVVELTGAFGPRDDAKSLENDLNAFEDSRRQMAERIENLSTAKEAEIVRLRTELKTAQAAIPSESPKKTIVDDTEPPKKPVPKKKTTTTKPKTPPPAPKPPAQSQQQNPNPQ